MDVSVSVSFYLFFVVSIENENYIHNKIMFSISFTIISVSSFKGVQWNAQYQEYFICTVYCTFMSNACKIVLEFVDAS